MRVYVKMRIPLARVSYHSSQTNQNVMETTRIYVKKRWRKVEMDNRKPYCLLFVVTSVKDCVAKIDLFGISIKQILLKFMATNSD